MEGGNVFRLENDCQERGANAAGHRPIQKKSSQENSARLQEETTFSRIPDGTEMVIDIKRTCGGMALYLWTIFVPVAQSRLIFPDDY